jgi:3-hydroxyacyl-[acyl-carrier-protein] dehydratase
MWIDRFTDFDYGRRASAIKAVSMTEEPIDLYLPGFPVMPCSLIIEGFAQTGGVLVAACTNFERRVVLAKVSKAVFHRPAVPGDTIAYTLELESTQPEGAIVRGTSRIGDAMHAEVDLSFAYLDDRMVEGDLIGPADLIAMLRLYGLFDVVQDAGGNPLQIPARLLNAERGAVANS